MHSQTPLAKLALTATLAATALPALAAAAAPALPVGKTDAPLARKMAAPAGTVSAIVKTTAVLTPTQEARITALGGTVTARLPIIGSVTVTLPTRNLAKLAALPFVTHLSYNGAVEKSDAFTVSASGAGAVYAAPTVYKDAAGNPLTGLGIGVAVVDSGVHVAPDLDPGPGGKGPHRVFGTFNAVSYPGSILPNGKGGTFNGVAFPLPQYPLPYDLCGHGTHVAGIIAGNGKWSATSTLPVYGIARSADIIDVRVLDAHGQGTVSGVIAGLQSVLDNPTYVGGDGKVHPIRVVNLSLGHPVGESSATDPLCQAAEFLWKAGIVVVCAAGNDGRLDSVQDQPDNEGWGTAYGSINSPGNDPYVITVGATKSTDSSRDDDRIATYSGRGPTRLDLTLKPDLVAPGNRIVSTDTSGESANKSYLDTAFGVQYSVPKSPGSYALLSGTSMATPVVSGAVALMLQKDPALTPDTIKVRLMIAADKMANWCDASGNYDVLTYGAGYLNIPAALASTTVAGQAAMSPSLSADAGGNVLVNSDHAIWGKSAIWGTGITDLHAIWGKNAFWGTNTLASSHAIWGTSVWSDHAIWGKSTATADLSLFWYNGMVFNGE